MDYIGNDQKFTNILIRCSFFTVGRGKFWSLFKHAKHSPHQGIMKPVTHYQHIINGYVFAFIIQENITLKAATVSDHFRVLIFKKLPSGTTFAQVPECTGKRGT